jgi:thiamine pyrophosphate-dependent acetolactate synthase large subunit-like protein
VYYFDSAFWTADCHKTPVLYVISNNGSYGVVARAFGNAGGSIQKTGEYAGVVLDNIDIVKIAEAYGVDGMHVQEESEFADAMERGLNVVEGEWHPYILNVHLPVGLPAGGRPAKPYHFPE